MNYLTDNNSCIIIAKWVDNSTMQLGSNFVGIEPVGSIQRWSKIYKARVPVNCPQIVMAYNANPWEELTWPKCLYPWEELTWPKCLYPFTESRSKYIVGT